MRSWSWKTNYSEKVSDSLYHTIYFQTETQRVKAEIPDSALEDFLDFVNASKQNVKIIEPSAYFDGID